MTDYMIQLPDGSLVSDGGLINAALGQAGLLRTCYKRSLKVNDQKHGLYRFADFLPAWDMLEHSAAPVTYQSEKLAQKLGLQNLLICYNGW